MLNKINNITNLFRKNVQQSSPSPLSGTAMDWYKNQNANNSVLVPGVDPFKVNDMFNKPLHKSIGNPTGFSLQDNPLSESLASGKTDFLGGLKNINSRIEDFAKGAGLSTGSVIDMRAGVVDSVAGAVGLKGAEVTTGVDTAIDTVASLPLELIPGVGTIAKGGLKALSLVNKYGGKKSKKQGTDYGLATLGYDKEFNPLADKQYGLFSRKSRRRANRLTARQDKSNLMKAVPGYNETQNMYASQNATQHTAEKNYQQLHGDMNLGLLTARLGTKMPPVNFRNIADNAMHNVKKKKAGSKKEELPEEKTLDRTERIKKAYEVSKQSKYKDGGLLTKADKKEVIEEVVEDKMNVIPEGAFHSRLNRIDESVSSHVTRKGIPVVTKQGDKIIQHAEVERNEIIFHKEATDTIESLLKKHEEAETDKLKDEIAIECGKYVANQILVNTDDRTGIIKTIEYA